MENEFAHSMASAHVVNYADLLHHPSVVSICVPHVSPWEFPHSNPVGNHDDLSH